MCNAGKGGKGREKGRQGVDGGIPWFREPRRRIHEFRAIPLKTVQNLVTLLLKPRRDGGGVQGSPGTPTWSTPGGGCLGDPSTAVKTHTLNILQFPHGSMHGKICKKALESNNKKV